MLLRRYPGYTASALLAEDAGLVMLLAEIAAACNEAATDAAKHN